MFVWAGNSGKMVVNERGIVKDHNQVRMQPKYDTDGYKYVEIGRTRYYVHELVIQNHGKPPGKNRLPKGDEVVIFLDGDKSNCHIDNLDYAEKNNDGTFRRPEGVPEAVEDYVWQLLKEGKTYTKIQDIISESNYEQRTISIGKIADIRRERSARASKGEEQLNPSEQASLDAIKKQLGETDDAEAKRQAISKKEVEEKSKKIKKEIAEKKKEEARKGDFDKDHTGGGWYIINKSGADVTDSDEFEEPFRFRKKQADEIITALAKDEQEGMNLIRQEYENRNS